MHWDPGTVLGLGPLHAPARRPAERQARGRRRRLGGDHRPRLRRATSRPSQVCPSDDPTGATPECTEATQPSNFLFLRTAPSATAPLFGDQAIHAGGDGTDRVNDWGSTAQAGQQFVVAGQQGDWTAIWFSGAKVWFHNPHGANTIPARGVTARQGRRAPPPAAVYGSSYPDAAEYPAGYGASTQAPLSMYYRPVRPGVRRHRARRRSPTTTSSPAARSSSAPRRCTRSSTTTAPRWCTRTTSSPPSAPRTTVADARTTH